MPRRTIARGLQLLGLIILPCGISANLAGLGSEGMTLMIAGVGIAIFYTGYALQNRAG
ncbi:MAG TPA: hypothetical protein VG406_07250 [Isosphaeraceae bacterium]|jgi:hypothetical protein|nr:hypothetical protein [Isosphaeraceae bacterium]